MYDEQELQRAHGSYYDQMRREFMSRAASVGYTVLDMQRPFMEHYKVNNAKFEFPEDGHWNALGHRLAAENIMRNKLFKLFLQRVLQNESDRALRIEASWNQPTSRDH